MTPEILIALLVGAVLLLAIFVFFWIHYQDKAEADRLKRLQDRDCKPKDVPKLGYPSGSTILQSQAYSEALRVPEYPKDGWTRGPGLYDD